MAAESASSNLPDSWKVEQLRLSVFLTETPNVPSEVWLSLIGSPSTTENIERNGTVSIYQASGSFGDHSPTLRVEPNRIDWTIGLAPGSMPAPFGVSVGDYTPTARSFVEFVKPFLAINTLPVVRMALGVVLSFPVASRQEGYNLLNSLLPSVDLDPNSSDFFYRINRRRRAANFEVGINRLSEWLVLELLPLPFIFGQIQGVNPVAVMPSQVSVASTFAARLQLDINTIPETQLLANHEQQIALLEEMLRFSDEISASGDIP